MMNRQQTVADLKHKLDQWNADLDRLEAKADQFGEERRRQLDATLDTLRQRRDAAHRKLEGMKQAGDDAFDDLRQGAIQALDTMQESLDQARQRFN